MSNLWRILYSDTVSAEQTIRECDFIGESIPVESHPRVLDLACETGRHSLTLASRGYAVTGVDMDPRALHVARDRAVDLGVEVDFVEGDLHELQEMNRTFDGIILFWQSFGFFSSEAQRGMFVEIHRLLRPGGILILDLFNRLYYTQGKGTAPFASGMAPRPTSWSEIERITSMIGYEEDKSIDERRMVDLLDPHLFTLGEIAGIAHNHGLHLLRSSSEYNSHTPATREHPRMQLVFRRIDN